VPLVQIIVILLVAYIIVPLIDLSFNERVKYAVKLVVYIFTLLWVLYTLLVGRLLV
jgi:hypothetical protein